MKNPIKWLLNLIRGKELERLYIVSGQNRAIICETNDYELASKVYNSKRCVEMMCVNKRTGAIIWVRRRA